MSDDPTDNGDGPDPDPETDLETDPPVEPDPDADRRALDVGEGGNGDDREIAAETVDDVIAANAFVELVGNSSRARVLAVLAGTHRPVNPTAIADAAGISRDTFYRHFDVFEEYGIVEQVGKAGSAPLYRFADTDLGRALEMVADHAGERKRIREGVRDGMDHD